METREASDGVNVDIDARGNLVGFDIDRAANRLDLSSLETTSPRAGLLSSAGPLPETEAASYTSPSSSNPVLPIGRNTAKRHVFTAR